MINKIWNWIKNIFKPEKQDPHLEMYEEVRSDKQKKYVENIKENQNNGLHFSKLTR